MLDTLAALIVLTAQSSAPPTFDAGDALIAEPPLDVRAHVRAMTLHRGLPPRERGAHWVDRSVKAGTAKPTREVHAYLPYWSLDYDAFHWDLLTTLAYFSAEMTATGAITDDHGWSDSPTVAAVRAEAQANGVRFILAVTLFDKNGIATLVNSATNRQTAVNNLVDLVSSVGGDGVNIDFEGVPSTAKAGLVTFMQELKAAMTAVGADYVTIATPAVDWSGAFDYDQLAYACDGLMIMGYDYHWSGSPQAGPNSPVTGGSLWGKYCLTWTVDDYIKYGLAENKHKFIVGLPFYGREWATASTSIPSDALGSGKSVVFTKCKTRAAAVGGFKWDAESQTSYFMESTGAGTQQIWCDDGPSMAAKMAMVETYDLGGIGIWALGYDGTTNDYWDPIADAIGTTPPVVPDAEPDADVGSPPGEDVGPTDPEDAGPVSPGDADAGGPVAEDDVVAAPPDAGPIAPGEEDVGSEPVSPDAGAPSEDTSAPGSEADTAAGSDDLGAPPTSNTGVVGVQRIDGDAGCALPPGVTPRRTGWLAPLLLTVALLARRRSRPPAGTAGR